MKCAFTLFLILFLFLTTIFILYLSLNDIWKLINFIFYYCLISLQRRQWYSFTVLHIFFFWCLQFSTIFFMSSDFLYFPSSLKISLELYFPYSSTLSSGFFVFSLPLLFIFISLSSAYLYFLKNWFLPSYILNSNLSVPIHVRFKILFCPDPC